ncbi:MAG: sugar transferase [Proteobacteria bacterium]|nr:sugar transferase [Pseudomonadota bacterium]
MKAVILSGSPGSAIFPLANYYPKLALPLGNVPLLVHHLNVLKKNAVTEVAIVLPRNIDSIDNIIERLNNYEAKGVKVSYFFEDYPRGTAGSLKELKDFLGRSPFWVICSNVFIEGLNLSKILDFHTSRQSGATVVVEEDNPGRRDLERIEVGEDGTVKRFHILHHSRDNRHYIRPVGIYVFEPDMLGYIPETGYMDIKEQLVPILNAKGIPVHTYKTETKTIKINSLTGYFKLNRELLLNGLDKHNKTFCSWKKFGDRIWVGKNVKISQDAYLLGPAIIGDNCIIEGNSKVIGPSTIGSGSNIGNDVLVHESIILENACLMNKSRVEYSLVGESCVVSEDETVRNAVVVQDKSCDGILNFVSSNLNDDKDLKTVFNMSIPGPRLRNLLKHKLFFVAKRLLDIICSLLGLLFLLPLFTFIALLIKRDSRGHVFFCQRRCGKDGQEFPMYKFRTMIEDADEIQGKLLKENDVDGPMFKMDRDPRLTKVGTFLRKTSLDELPQLFNVLNGDMSLIGPRPLVMEEMKFAPSWRDIRLNVKPGITGLWQVNGRSDTSFHDWIRYDIAYVKSQSFKMDMKIFLKTIMAVIKGVGAK